MRIEKLITGQVFGERRNPIKRRRVRKRLKELDRREADELLGMVWDSWFTAEEVYGDDRPRMFFDEAQAHGDTDLDWYWERRGRRHPDPGALR
jgi:hypothetical protein